MTVLLALDSSTENLSLALSGPKGLHLVDAEGGAKASEQMLPQLLALLAQGGLALSEVDAIAFGQGPGAFTGLRTACAVAQGLAFGAGKPVLAIDSLMLVAQDARSQALAEAHLPVPEVFWVAMDARMGEVYAACYAWQDGAWQTLSAPALYSPAALLAQWSEEPPSALCGSALTEFASLAEAAQRCWPRQQARAAALAALAEQAWAAGRLLDAAAAIPVYVRDKVAQTTEERLAARASS